MHSFFCRLSAPKPSCCASFWDRLSAFCSSPFLKRVLSLNSSGRACRSNALAVVLKHTLQLTALDLGSCTMVSAKALATLDGLQQLQDLNLKECQTLSMEGFNSLVVRSQDTDSWP